MQISNTSKWIQPNFRTYNEMRGRTKKLQTVVTKHYEQANTTQFSHLQRNEGLYKKTANCDVKTLQTREYNLSFFRAYRRNLEVA